MNAYSPYLIIVPLITVMVLSIPTSMGNLAYAEIFGISLDNTCLTKIKNNIGGNCPTYQEIMLAYPDTSNPNVLGDFGYKNDIYQRLHSKVINPLEYYRYNYENYTGNHYFIDPPPEIRDRINMIEIRSNFNYYHVKDSSYNSTEHSITIGVGRYANIGCTSIYLDSSRWIALLGDTLIWMLDDCNPDSTNFNSTYTTYLDRVQHDITTSYKWKMEKWQNAFKNNASNVDELYKDLNS